jgi:protein-disulfide isomerase
VIVGCAFAGDGGPKADTGSAGNDVVARFGDQTVTGAELADQVAGPMLSLKQQIYNVKVDGLKQLIFDRLVEAEAEAAGITKEEYLKKNIDDKIPAPPEEEITKVLNQYRQQLPPDDEEARKRVVEFLSRKGRAEAQQSFQSELFAKNDVKILLDPPRAEVEIAEHNPAVGPDDAPVTLVEYTDFQCPYCGRAQDTLKEVAARYDGVLKHVFKNLPLPMHSNARVAAEASLCAADQGKFWELHDWMFANGSSLTRESIVAQAVELGMDEAKLNACLDEKTHAADVDADMEEAHALGINGTPGFMINGRLINGARPIDDFIQIIDDELERAGIDPAKVKKDPPPKPEPEPAATAGGGEQAEQAEKAE